MCKKDENELLKEQKKKGKERNNELPYYANICKYQFWIGWHRSRI